MHELAIAQSIVDVVEEQANAYNVAHVKEVRLRIGEANGVVVDSLAFCFDMLASFDPLLVGARLAVDLVPYQAYCRTCSEDFIIANFIPQCPRCKGWSNEIVSGNELQVLEMDFDTLESMAEEQKEL